MISPYFDAQKHAIRQSSGSASETSLVEDGKNTALLRKKVDSYNHLRVHELDREPQKWETSPIGSFSDDEVQVKGKMENSSAKPPSRVGELVAIYNEMSHPEQVSTVPDRSPMRIVDFKKPKAKERMQPKSSTRFNGLKVHCQSFYFSNPDLKVCVSLCRPSLKMS